MSATSNKFRLKTLIIGLSALLLIAFVALLPTFFGKSIVIHKLQKRLHGPVTIREAHLSWMGPQTFQDLQITHNNILVVAEELTVSNTLFQILFGKPQYKAAGHGHSILKNAKGSFNFTLDFEQNILQATTKATNFPSEILDEFLSYHEPNLTGSLTTALGDTFNLDLSLDAEDKLSRMNLSVRSAKAEISLVGQTDNGILTLDRPFTFQIQLTPELTKLLFKKANPLTLNLLAWQNPVKLSIPPEGFRLPLLHFSIENLAIPNARLELGQVVCSNVGALNTSLALLKSSYSDDPNLTVWFAPIDLHLTQGQLTIERTEMLIDKQIEICTFGSLDLIRDRADMTLGLTKSALQKTLGIEDLPKNYLLFIPLTGPLNHIEIDNKKAAKKIAALLLWQQSKAAGDLAKLIGKLAPLPDEKKKVPSAKHPFPWEK